jgi:rhomboid protease GluP
MTEETARQRNILLFPKRMTPAKIAPATATIIAVNVLVFTAMLFCMGSHTLTAPSAKELLAWGADYGPYTMHGQFWRLFTAMFLHIGVLHIGMNMWALWSLGAATERLFGTRRFLALYLLSGLGGSCVSVLVNPTVIGAGASGAIFGALGGLLGFATLRKMIEPNEALNRLQRAAINCIVINFLISLSIPGIDSSAHLGGLVFGIIAGAVYLRGPIRGVSLLERTRVIWGTLAIIGMLVAIGAVAAYRVRGTVM